MQPKHTCYLFKTFMLCCMLLFALRVAAQPTKAKALTQQQRLSIIKQNFLTGTQWFNNNGYKGRQVPATTFKHPYALAGVIKQYTLSSASHGNSAQTANAVTAAAPLTCNDTSFVKLISFSNNAATIYATRQTADGNILLCGVITDVNAVPYAEKVNGFICKTDGQGNILWSQVFNDATDDTYNIIIANIQELANGDLLATGDVGVIAPNTFNTYFKAAVFRLTSTGGIIWKNTFTTNIGQTPGQFAMNFKTITESAGGDILLAGTTFSTSSVGDMFATIVRLDKNGNKIWDQNFGNISNGYGFGVEGLNAILQNSNITAVMLSHGDGIAAPGIVFTTLNYNTGSIITKRFFIPDYSDQTELFHKSFNLSSNFCTLLKNGHFIIYGNLFSDIMQDETPIDHYGVTEFDENQNLINNAYTISSNISSTYVNNTAAFGTTGDGVFGVTHVTDQTNSSSDVVYGYISKSQIIKQRVTAYNNVTVYPSSGSFGNNQWCMLADGGYLLAEPYYKSGLLAGAYVELRKMHNTDTSSVCLGNDTNAVFLKPLQFKEDPTYSYFDTQVIDAITASSYSEPIGGTIQWAIEDACVQKDNCDTVAVHGDSIICGTQQALLFTAYKSKDCGSAIMWHIDTSAVSSFNTVNDTTVSVIFKNKNWQGYVTAVLTSSAKCTLPIQDSMQVRVAAVKDSLNLGADTTLCSGGGLVLHAGPNFTKYTWQDGKTDSVYTVTKTGKYYVIATGTCGNTLSDTIKVTINKLAFSAGIDIAKCNNDTVILHATQGFTHYRWQTFYTKPGTDTTANVTVFPPNDTAYIVTAQQSGCTVSDTIAVKVLHSPSIFLGNDTSLCAGQLLKLDAGSSFYKYTWNTGDDKERITVNTPGTYTVTASASNGCTSTDSLTVLSIIPLPVFTLGADTALCPNAQLAFNFNLPGASYVWSTGSTTGTETLSIAGDYWLTVTQQGCQATDSITLSSKSSPVINIGSDTTLCEGVQKVLNATTANASYLWQDGSTSSTFTVNAAGAYNVQVTVDGCPAGDTIAIQYLPLPQVKLGADTFVCAGVGITLTPVVNTAVNYLWQDGTRTNNYTASAGGTYTVQVSNQCSTATASVKITSSLCKLIMPSAFTPNGDNLNDVFKIKYPFAVQKFTLLIYNRWGQKMFETANIGEGWDGRFNGAVQPTGAYVWYISLIDGGGVKQSAKGTVILLK